ncbi:Uncharacterised protein [Serratia fonticola]|uniref:Uncharacterized protein n=1 Tax=Serratia fonticola TaxID=47917 RepID=A0A4V6KUX6_SERFO|nr:Uncharacterised protein [Serratia fonticola]
MHQFQFAVAELEVGTTDVFTPFMSLDDPGTVLAIWRARRARYVIHLFVVFTRHTDRILRMPTDNHIQVARRQATCHLYVPRRVGAMVTIVVVPHVGGSDNHVRLFIFAQLIHHLLGFLRREHGIRYR